MIGYAYTVQDEHDAATGGYHFDEPMPGCAKCEQESLETAICLWANDPDAVRKLMKNG